MAFMLVRAGIAAVVAVALAVMPAFAESKAAMAPELQLILKEIKEQEARISAQARAIADQERRLGEQRNEIMRQKLVIEQLSSSQPLALNLDAIRGTGDGPVVAAMNEVQPVGQAPPPREEESSTGLEALPEGSGVMTPAGAFVFDPSRRSSSPTPRRTGWCFVVSRSSRACRSA
jgi:hypothetical protein